MSSSKRPGRSNAGSISVGRLVAPISTTFCSSSSPSISARMVLTTRSVTCGSPRPPPRAGTRLSSSSMKMIVGATNRPTLIDPALLRPGRFDELIYVGTPDETGRARILAIHTRDMPLAKDVDLAALAKRTDRFTGADQEEQERRAGLTALRRGMDAAEVTMADFESALGEPRASVTPEMLAEYSRIQEPLKSSAVRPMRGIGFVLPGMLHSRPGGKPD